MISKTLDPHRLFPNLTDITHLKKSDKYVALSSLYIYVYALIIQGKV